MKLKQNNRRPWLPTLILSLGVAVFLSACVTVTSGAKFPADQTEKVTIGMPAAQVKSLLGEPFIVESYSEGERWIWVYSSGHSDHAFVAAIEDGSVSSYSEYKDYDF